MIDRKESYNHTDIFKILPHRFPFLLVDRVIEIKRSGHQHGIGDSIRAIKNVTFNEPFFQGHFPEIPIMPGVLIIEALAQAAGLLAHKPHPKGGKWGYFIAGIDGARFRKPVGPGVTLELRCKCIKVKSGFHTFECEAWGDGEKKAEAEILAQLVL